MIALKKKNIRLFKKNLSACLACMVFHVPLSLYKDLLNTCIISNVHISGNNELRLTCKMSKSTPYPLQTLTTIR